jgi:hypothetical protein
VKNKNSRSGIPTALLWAIILVAAAIAIIGFTEITGVTHVFRKAQTNPAPSANAETKGEGTPPGPSLSPGTTGQTPEDGDKQPANGSTGTATPPRTPEGVFVSNHHPGENGSPTKETSVCTTTPGATCQILFVKDGVTKSLATQTTDKGGSAYWNNWEVHDTLTPGTWQVKAVATLNGQSATAVDATELVVQ